MIKKDTFIYQSNDSGFKFEVLKIHNINNKI